MPGSPNDRAVRIGVILDWLENGKITLADACTRIRGMKLGEAPDRSAGQVLAAHANGDLPVPEGTFADISSAYASGRLTRFQYERLAAAAGGVSPA